MIGLGYILSFAPAHKQFSPPSCHAQAGCSSDSSPPGGDIGNSGASSPAEMSFLTRCLELCVRMCVVSLRALPRTYFVTSIYPSQLGRSAISAADTSLYAPAAG